MRKIYRIMALFMLSFIFLTLISPFLGIAFAEGYQGQAGGYQGQAGGYQGKAGGYQGQAGGYQGQAGGYQGKAGGYQGQAGGYQGQAEGYKGQAGGYEGSKDNNSGSKKTNPQGKPKSDDNNKGFLPDYWPGLKYVGKNLLTDYFGEHNSYKVKRNKDFLKGIGRKKSEYDWKARYAVKALRNGFGLLLPSHDDPDNPKKDDQQRPSLLKTGLDAWDAVDKARDVIGLYEDWRYAEVFAEAPELLSKSSIMPGGKILTKANPIFSGIGTLLGAVETVDNFVKGDVASGIQSLGDTLMSAGPLIALASPPAGFVVGVV